MLFNHLTQSTYQTFIQEHLQPNEISVSHELYTCMCHQFITAKSSQIYSITFHGYGMFRPTCRTV